jgi:hypothetical protein
MNASRLNITTAFYDMNTIFHITTQELYFRPIAELLSDMRPHHLDDIYKAIELLIHPGERHKDWRYNVRFAIGKMHARGWFTHSAHSVGRLNLAGKAALREGAMDKTDEPPQTQGALFT